MKILHTGDWHLGHVLYGYDRTEEQQQMLRQMVDIVSVEQPDVFLLCGDVFHTSQPSASVQTMFNHALVQMHHASPQTTIVVTAGNHDSATKHEIFRTPWQQLGVYMIGTLSADQPDTHIIEIPGKGYVVAFPYMHERVMRSGIVNNVLQRVGERNTTALPVVLTLHTALSGADFTGHDDSDENTIGGIDTINVNDIASDYDYLALGHIHHAQFVHTGRHNVRYAGSPLSVSFDECYKHSVSIVEISSHGAQPEVRTIDINNPHPLTTLPIQGFAAWDDVKQQLTHFPADLQCYIRLNVEVTDHLPSDARQQALEATEGKQCRFCYINATRAKTETQRQTQELTVQEFQQMPPIEVARMFAHDTGAVFDEQMEQMFNQTLQALNDTTN